ncbi:MAG TPA: carboxypeptidase regulatory-like domain-containing protein [Terriglobales bacterium]|nr:carboxypeptidase regulatory-like domain-containing protein [Terriglobales bacterium]
MISSHKYHLRILFMALTCLLVFLAANAQAADEKPSWQIEGKVTQNNGSPIQGASVRLERSGAGPQRITTDADGKFLFIASSKGAYVLRIEKPGFQNQTQSIVVPPKNVGPLVIELIPVKPTVVSGESPEPMQFSDSTDFTVAGITDWTAAGGHGSDVNLRASEALAKETRGLASGSPNEDVRADSPQLSRRRDQLRMMISRADRADLHRQLGDIDEQMNDSLAAVHEYERAVQLDPTEQNYFAWATELLLHRAIQPAAEVFKKGAAAYPHSERMLAGLGTALYASGLYAQGAERLCAASDLDPADVTPYMFLGKMVQASSQALPCTEEKLARFLREHPENAFASYYLAVALWKRLGLADSRVADRVEELLDKSLKINSKFAEAYLQQGIVYAATAQMSSAITAYEKAIEADPNLAEAHFRLAQAYKKLNQPEKAHQEFATYEKIQNTKAAAIEQQRREIQQFVIVYKDKPPISTAHTP